MKLEPLFAYVLCAVPPALIDVDFGVLDASPAMADVVIVDVSQLFYHIVWPHGAVEDHERLRRASEGVIDHEL